MIIYLSVPFSVKDKYTTQTAANIVQKKIAKLYKASPDLTPVSGILCWYNNPDITSGIHNDKDIYPFSRNLIDSSDVVCVIRAPGWEYSDIVMQESSYAAVSQKQISYIDP